MTDCAELSGQGIQTNDQCAGTWRDKVRFPACNCLARRCRLCLQNGRRGRAANPVVDVETGLCAEHQQVPRDAQTPLTLPSDPHKTPTLGRGFPQQPRVEPTEPAEEVIEMPDGDVDDASSVEHTSLKRASREPSAAASSRAPAATRGTRTSQNRPVSKHAKEAVSMTGISLAAAAAVAEKFKKAKVDRNVSAPPVRGIYEAVLALNRAGKSSIDIGSIFGYKRVSGGAWVSSILGLSRLTPEAWALVEGKDVSLSLLVTASRYQRDGQCETIRKTLDRYACGYAHRRLKRNPPEVPSAAAEVPERKGVGAPPETVEEAAPASPGVPAVIVPEPTPTALLPMAVGGGISVIPISDEMLAAGIKSGAFKKGHFVFIGPPDENGVSRGRIVSFGS